MFSGVNLARGGLDEAAHYVPLVQGEQADERLSRHRPHATPNLLRQNLP